MKTPVMLGTLTAYVHYVLTDKYSYRHILYKVLRKNQRKQRQSNAKFREVFKNRRRINRNVSCTEHVPIHDRPGK